MLVRLLPIVKEDKPEHPLKAQSPIAVTLFGILIEVKPVQSENAEFPMLVTPSPIIYSETCAPKIVPILLLNEYDLLTMAFELIVTFIKFEQLEKAFPPMLVTLFGISIEVKPVQPLKV